jgi:hypothetical protein
VIVSDGKANVSQDWTIRATQKKPVGVQAGNEWAFPLAAVIIAAVAGAGFLLYRRKASKTAVEEGSISAARPTPEQYSPQAEPAAPVVKRKVRTVHIPEAPEPAPKTAEVKRAVTETIPTPQPAPASPPARAVAAAALVQGKEKEKEQEAKEAEEEAPEEEQQAKAIPIPEPRRPAVQQKSMAVVDKISVDDLEDDEEAPAPVTGENDEGVREEPLPKVRDVRPRAAPPEAQRPAAVTPQGLSGLRRAPCPFGDETEALQSMTNIRRGLPGSLAGMDMQELAAMLSTAEYRETESGDTIVKLGRKWYHGDPKDPETYLQQFKG